MTGERHWAQIAETGTEIGMSILVFAYRLGGAPLFRVCLFPVICFYFLLRADSRRASRDYLERVRRFAVESGGDYPEGGIGPVNSWLVFRHFWQFGLAMIDKVAVWLGKIPADKLDLYNRELVDQLMAEGRGAIFAISHLGNFEVLNAMSSIKHRGVRLTVLHHTLNAEKFNRVIGKHMDANHIEFMQVTQLDAALAMQLSERVQQGEFVAIACDRIPIDNPNALVQCQFLGEVAAFPQGGYILAQVLEAPLIYLACFKEGDRFQVHFAQLSEGQPVPRSKRMDFIEHTAQAYVCLLQSHVLLHPLQWFNFYSFWAPPTTALRPGEQKP